MIYIKSIVANFINANINIKTNCYIEQKFGRIEILSLAILFQTQNL